MIRRRGNGPPDRFLILLHIEWRGKPGTIRVDNGPEYISGKLLEWAEKQGVTIQHIQPGQPQQNAYIRCPADGALHRREGSATTAPSGTNGWTNIPSKPSSLTAIACNRLPANGRPKTTPRNGWTYNNDRPNIPLMVCRQTIAGQRGIGGITQAQKLKMAA